MKKLLLILFLVSGYLFSQDNVVKNSLSNSAKAQSEYELISNTEITSSELESIAENDELYYQTLNKYYTSSLFFYHRLLLRGIDTKKPQSPNLEEATTADANTLSKYLKKAKDLAKKFNNSKDNGNDIIDIFKSYENTIKDLRTENEKLKLEALKAKLDSNNQDYLWTLSKQLIEENNKLQEEKILTEIKSNQEISSKIKALEKMYSNKSNFTSSLLSLDVGGNVFFSGNSQVSNDANFLLGLNLNTAPLLGLSESSFELFGELNQFETQYSNYLYNTNLYSFGLNGIVEDVFNIGGFKSNLKLGLGFFFADIKSPNQILNNSNYRKTSYQGQMLKLELAFRNILRNHPLEIFIGYRVLFANDDIIYSAPTEFNIGRQTANGLNLGIRFNIWNQYGE